jgi:hypothetical protein
MLNACACFDKKQRTQQPNQASSNRYIPGLKSHQKKYRQSISLYDQTSSKSGSLGYRQKVSAFVTKQVKIKVWFFVFSEQ